MNTRKAGKSARRIVVLFGSIVLLLLSAGPLLPEQAHPARPKAIAASPPSAAVKGAPAVNFVAGKLTVKADEAELAEILKRVSSEAGIPVIIGAGIAGTVSVSFEGLGLEEGLNRILEAAGQKNLTTEYARRPGQKRDEFTIEKISILRKSTAPEPSAAEIQEAIRKRDQEYRELFTKMDQEGNKVARALSEYRDPKTRPEKKTKLRTYLRQTRIDNPNDKKLLKAALHDPEIKGEIVSDIQLALLHAIQGHPDESDKEYILELLEKRENNIGWLYYTMLKIWDDRYVPYLMEGLKNQPRSRLKIEILGRAKVKEAVPFLEDALKDKNPSVRGEAWDALFLITGKKYDFPW